MNPIPIQYGTFKDAVYFLFLVAAVTLRTSLRRWRARRLGQA